MTPRTFPTPVLEIAVEESGDPAGPPVVLLHGFPYDPRCFDAVVPRLGDARVLVPYLRGYGATRFRSPDALRSGQQAALGHDLLDLLDAAGIERAVVAGFDWGGRAACVLAALRPERVAGLVTVGGYNIQDIAHADAPATPAAEATFWYQYVLQLDRGRRLLEEQRDAFLAKLWRDWSPSWEGARTAFAASATSFDNPDFTDVVVHSYRHRYGVAPGDPAYDDWEAALAEQPAITVPTTVLLARDDGVGGPDEPPDEGEFTGPLEVVALPGVGHDVPQEAPAAFADAVLALLGRGVADIS